MPGESAGRGGGARENSAAVDEGSVPSVAGVSGQLWGGKIGRALGGVQADSPGMVGRQLRKAGFERDRLLREQGKRSDFRDGGRDGHEDLDYVMGERKDNQPRIAGTPGATRTLPGVRLPSRVPLGTGRRQDRSVDLTIMESFPTVLSPHMKPTSVTPPNLSGSETEFSLDVEVGLRLGLDRPEETGTEEEAAVRVTALPPDWSGNLEELERPFGVKLCQVPAGCPLCGYYAEPGMPARRQSFRVAGLGWAACERCHTIYRRQVESLDSGGSAGLMLPYQQVHRRLVSRAPFGDGHCIDFSPEGRWREACEGLYASTLTGEELDKTAYLGAGELICFYCVENCLDPEWALELLRFHLADSGVLRLFFLASPFERFPRDVFTWLSSKGMGVRQIPSRKGVDTLLDRLGLTVVARRRSANVLITGGRGRPFIVSPGFFWPWKSVRLGVDLWNTVMNVGLGEELVLRRKSIVIGG